MDSLKESKDDFTCPICMYIMIQPVTMPCKHSLCMMCYKQCVAKASLACPICRLRISVWARKSSKSNTLIDRIMWETIQKRFPVEVRNKIEGKDDSTDDWDSPNALETRIRQFKELSEPGEIRQEYEAALAKLERQREEEAEKEEEASAALIRALQEEEEEELTKLMKEREERARLDRLAAEQLHQEKQKKDSHSLYLKKLRNNSRNGRSSSSSHSNKQKRCESASMKLESFYNSVRKSSSSAPPCSELAATITHSNSSQGMRKNGRSSKTEYSPYPYPCLSPSEKQQQAVTSCLPSQQAAIDETDEISPYLQEHSYTSASAKIFDLTLPENEELSSLLRDDVQNFVKTEPPDQIDEEDPLVNGIVSNDIVPHTFQPICSSLKTPPKKLSSGELVDPVLIRSIPRSLTFNLGQSKKSAARSPSSSSCSSEIFLDQSQSLDFRDVESVCKKNLLSRQDKTSAIKLSSSIINVGGCSTDEKSEDDYVDKMNLTRKIVYGTSKHKKTNRPVSSTCTSSLHSTVPSSSASTSSSTIYPCLNSSTTTTELAKRNIFSSTSSNCMETNNSTNSESNSKQPVELDQNQNDVSDYFITNDEQLIIPLDSDIAPSDTGKCGNNNSDPSHGMDKSTLSTIRTTGKLVNSNSSTSHNGVKDKAVQGMKNKNSEQNYFDSASSLSSLSHDAKKTIATKKPHQAKRLHNKPGGSRSLDPEPSTSSSVRDWCLGSKRKAGSDSTPPLDHLYNGQNNTHNASDSDSKSKRTVTPEEADRLFALELQELYNNLDKRGIKVDRFEGSNNEYSLRKKRRLC